MRFKKAFLILYFGLLPIFVNCQNKNFPCTKDLYEDKWLSEQLEFLNYWIEKEEISLTQNSYWLFGGGEGETSTSNSVLIIPDNKKTVIYQYSPSTFLDKQIVKKKITVEYLDRYFKELNKNYDGNYAHNAKFFAINSNKRTKDKCLKIFYSLEFPPEKKRDEFLIDFNKIVSEMNE